MESTKFLIDAIIEVSIPNDKLKNNDLSWDYIKESQWSIALNNDIVSYVDLQIIDWDKI